MLGSISVVKFAAVGAGTLVLAGALVYGAGTYCSLLSLEGLVIVAGGSIANAFLSYQREDVKKAFIVIRHLLKKWPGTQEGLHKDIMQIIVWAHVARKEDFIGLEKECAGRIRDPLLRYGIDLVISDYSAARIREMLHTVTDAEFERRCAPVTVLRNMAATAPSFGMVGTLIGMIAILKNVGTDISGIGGGMAIAMLSTLYGILAARLICLPAADKLLQKEESERFRSYMLAEGLALIAEKRSPFYVQDRLNSFLEPSRQFSLHDYARIIARRPLALAA